MENAGDGLRIAKKLYQSQPACILNRFCSIAHIQLFDDPLTVSFPGRPVKVPFSFMWTAFILLAWLFDNHMQFPGKNPRDLSSRVNAIPGSGG